MRKDAKRSLNLPPVAPIVRFGAVGVAFLLGVSGFMTAYADAGIPATLGQSAFRSIRLIVGNFPEELEAQNLPLALHVARWALPLLTFWSTIALAWVQLRNPIRLYFIRARGDHLVVAGDRDDAGGLAARTALSELRGGRRILLWPQDRRDIWVQDAVEQGAAEIEQGGGTESLDQLALEKARAVLLLSRDARTNIALATRAAAQAAAKRPVGDPLDIILRIDDLDLRRSVESRFDSSDRKTARIRIASLPDIAARQLSLDRPLDGFMRQDSAARRILVIGFSATIERFILRTLAGGHYRDGGKPAFFVHIPGAAQVEEGFRTRNPAADTLSPARFVEARADPSFVATLLDRFIAQHGPPIAVIIDQQADNDRALAIALAVDARYLALDQPAPPIHVRMDGAYEMRLGAGIFPFGGLAEMADTDMLLQDRHDALARSVHDFYLEGRFAEGDRIGSRASMQEWEDLPESFRDDNRLVADCYQLKLRDIGARLIDGPGQTFALAPDELEELSRAEHDRWMAAKLVQGWTHGATRDDARRIHPDIVPYDDLSEAIKDLDREQVRIMARLLASAGQRALRTLMIAVAPGTSLPSGGAAALLAALTAHYPDRIPVFRGDFADDRSRVTLLALQMHGHLIQFALVNHVQKVIDYLPGTEQAATAAAYRAADRIHAVSAPSEMVDTLAADADLILGDLLAGDSRSIVISSDSTILKAPWTR